MEDVSEEDHHTASVSEPSPNLDFDHFFLDASHIDHGDQQATVNNTNTDTPTPPSNIHIATVHARGQDNRPHSNIQLFGISKHCLLDSGASSSIAGNKGIMLLQSLSIPLINTTRRNRRIRSTDRIQGRHKNHKIHRSSNT